MMRSPSLTLLCCVLLFCVYALGDDYPYPVEATQVAPPITASAGLGSIYYQKSDFFFLRNVVNPVTVRITYSSGANYPANFCFNSYAESLPISGVDLEITCPSGAFGTLSNTTQANGQAFDDTPDDATDDSDSADVFLKPGNDLGFVVTIPNAPASQQFTLLWTAMHCENQDYFPVGSNNQCIPIENIDLPDSKTVNIGAGTWKYYRLTAPAYTYFTNSLNVTYTGAKEGIEMYLQKDYIPTQEWAMNPDISEDDDETTAVIMTPGYSRKNEVFYIGLYNTNTAASTVTVSTKVGECSFNATTGFASYGYDCRHKSTNATAAGGVLKFSAMLTNATATTGPLNNGSTISMDLSDEDLYSHDYAYFRIVDYPMINNGSFFIRVSVGNNDVTNVDGAPPVFAKLGALPSAQSNDYNISTIGDVVHQLSLPVTQDIFSGGNPTEDNSWYVAVQLPSDFSIWVGTNCANNCSDGDHGDCMCNGDYCTKVVSGLSDSDYFYALPYNTSDSGGACSCSKDKYSFSFDCTQKNNGNSALYILLIAFGGLIVLAVAIGVPIYCYIANKKAKTIDEI